MKGLRYSPLHVTEFCGEMQGKFKVGLARLITYARGILTRFDIKFLENCAAWGFHRGATWRNELQREVLNSIQKVNVV